jgi:MFS-type transporter involved in bile tolerance (Atg22 family)
VDPRAWIVAALFGLAAGVLTGRIRTDRQIILGALALTFLIGMVTWIVARDSIAGPSLTVGGGVALLAGLLTARSFR